MRMASPADALAVYRARRDFARTPEPIADPAPGRTGRRIALLLVILGVTLMVSVRVGAVSLSIGDILRGLSQRETLNV